MLDGATPDSATSSPVLSFTTPPAPGSDTSFVVLMAADIGQAQVDGSSQAIANKPGALGVRGGRRRWHPGLWMLHAALGSPKQRCAERRCIRCHV